MADLREIVEDNTDIPNGANVTIRVTKGDPPTYGSTYEIVISR